MTHSVPHAFATAFHTPQGIILHSGDFKIDLHPVDGRRTDLARMGALASDPGIRLLLADSTNAEEPGFTPSESTVGATLRKVFLARPGPPVHRDLLRQPHPPGPAGGRRRHRRGPVGGHPRPLHAEERGPGPRARPARTSPTAPLVDIEDVDDYPPGQVCVISTGSQGEPMSALSRLAIGENRFFKLRDGRRGGDQRPPHPRQRVVGGPGHRQPAPAGRRGHPLRGRTGPRERPRPPGRAGHADVGDQTRVLHPGARGVPPHGQPRPAGRLHGHRRGPGAPVRGRRRRAAWTAPGCSGTGPSPAATSSSTAARSATSATASSGTGWSWPRRAWSWPWPPSTSSGARWWARPRS